MIKAVVYDLDGTLIDSTEAIVHSFFHTFDVLGLPHPPREAVVKSIGYTLEQQFGLLTDANPHECTRIYRERYGQVCCDMTFLLPGAEESLRLFADAGLKLGFASSKRRQFAEIILRHLGVLDYFAVRIGPDEVTHPKPHPEAVAKSAELLGVSPRELFFIGDTHFDVLAARAAGVRCLCVTTGYATREELIELQPEALFDSLLDLTRYALDSIAGGAQPMPVSTRRSPGAA